MTGVDNARNKAAYKGRKQLFAVVQRSRGLSVLKEKLQALGSSGILADHQLQAQLQEHHMKRTSQLTISDIAQNAFLFSVCSHSYLVISSLNVTLSLFQWGSKLPFGD